jgi:hypothetical protein
MPAVNDVGEPCAGEPHARFDGRELETEPRTRAKVTGMEQPTGKPAAEHHHRFQDLQPGETTAPVPDPTTFSQVSQHWSSSVTYVANDESTCVGNVIAFRCAMSVSRSTWIDAFLGLVGAGAGRDGMAG